MKGLKRLLLASAISASCIQGAWAIGAYPRPIVMRQPDGTTLLVRIQGDENYHFVTSSDGFFLQRDKKGYFCYVDYDLKTGKRTLTRQRAHNIDERTDAEKKVISRLTASQTANADYFKRNRIERKAPAKTLDKKVIAPRRVLGKNAKVKESQYLVILVNFSDSTMRYKNSDFDRWLNEPGYSVNGGTGSVKDYYRDNSMGQYVPNFQVVGPYTLSKPTAYYGGNTGDSGTDTNPRDMVREALELARQNNPDLNFAQFDNDGDGEMDNCYIIYAGYSEASTANTDDIWPHSWNFTTADANGDVPVKPEYDGIKVNNYSCSAELVGMPGAPAKPSMDGIGTFTHEFGHVLGLKDMYDTDNTDNGVGIDPGDYSLYASGSYNNESRTPPYLMAFERMQMGWMTEGDDIVEIKNPEDVSLESLSENKARFINAQPNREPGTGMEWFILENRQQTGWDKYIPAHGLLITHYDYTKEKQEQWWNINGPNNVASHRCLYIVPADGIDDSNTRSGDTFPGSSANTSFTDNTTPNSRNWNNEPLGVPVTNINEGDGIVSFQVSGGTSRWNTIKTLEPDDVRDKSATFRASVDIASDANVTEAGFCWALSTDTKEPAIGNEYTVSKAVADAAKPTLSVEGLLPGVQYGVRSYMKLAGGDIVYGSTVPFSTECATADVTVDEPFYSNFLSWTNGQPDCWQIIDNNGDGTSWIADESANAILYSFNYWNDADDYLICKRRIHVPENGALFFTRGVTEETSIENLEVLVSTKTSKLQDFNLLERLSFADDFGNQHMEEVDLSQYAGKDIYIAFRCCSDKMQGYLWLWNMMVMKKLDTPVITKFERTDKGSLHAEWTPVEGATQYYVYFGKETDKTNNEVVFVPTSYLKDVLGDVDTSVGSLFFKSSGTVTLKDFPDGITDCKFIVTTSGPFGSSTLSVEGTRDGKVWQAVGPKTTCKEYDSEGQEVDLSSYLKGKNYRTLRFKFNHGGRNARIKYLTLFYNNGKVYDDLAAGAVDDTTLDINEKTSGEFATGKYKLWVASGWQNIFYDESVPAYYDKTATSIHDVIDGTGISLTSKTGNICVSGVKAGSIVTCTTAAGIEIFRATANGGNINIPTAGNEGFAIISVSCDGDTYRTKTVIR